MTGTKPYFFYGHLLVFSGFLIMVSMYGTLYSFGVFLEPLLNELGRTRASISGAYSLCFLLSGALAMAAGWLTDRFGPRVVISCAGILIASGYLMLSRANTILELYLYYGLFVGAGMSGGMIPVLSTITKWFEKRKGLMTGFAIAGVGAGTLIVPPVANALIYAYGWRTSFFLAGIVAFAVITGLAQLFIRDPLGKGMLPYGSEGPMIDPTQFEMEGLSLQDACRSAQLWIVFAIYVCAGFFIQIALVHITIYAISLGVSPSGGAMLLSVVGMGSLAGRIIGGAASDRLGSKTMIVAASILMTAQFSWLLFSNRTWMLLVFALFFGLVYREILCMMPLLPAELFGLKNHGVIMGIIAFASTIGGSMGPVAAGAVFDAYGGYKIVWLTCIGVAAVSFLLSMSVKSRA